MCEWFRIRGCRATLGEILRSGELWVHEFNARKTDARKRGIEFVLQRGSKPSENVYRMIEGKGQLDLAM
jgi:hypothetical protein